MKRRTVPWDFRVCYRLCLCVWPCVYRGVSGSPAQGEGAADVCVLPAPAAKAGKCIRLDTRMRGLGEAWCPWAGMASQGIHRKLPEPGPGLRAADGRRGS